MWNINFTSRTDGLNYVSYNDTVVPRVDDTVTIYGRSYTVIDVNFNYNNKEIFILIYKM